MDTRDDEDAAKARAELAHWGEPALNALDALMWRTERHPSDSWTGVVVQLLDEAPAWERIQAAHRWALRVVPRFTERVVEPLVPTGPPIWSVDPTFDLDYHLAHRQLGGTATLRDVLDMAQKLAVKPLDRGRPPWRAFYIEGLEDGRAAYLLQTHHVMMDGAGATQLFSRVLDHDDRQAVQAAPQLQERPRVSRDQAALRGLAWQASSVRGLARAGARGLLNVSARPTDSWKRTLDYLASIQRVASPPPPAESDLLVPGSRTSWRFGVMECPLADLKKAGKAAGGTVNDAFVSSILGGLRKYHERHGTTMGDVPISMPVSVRKEGDPMGGNRFTAAFFAAPSGTADPGERIRVMRERVERVRSEPALDFINKITPMLNLAPSPLVAATVQGLNAGATLTTSSWPGLQFDTYLAGARLDRMFVFGPLPGTSMCAALCTHVGTCCIAINVDGDVFPDTDVLWECMDEGLQEVLALGG